MASSFLDKQPSSRQGITQVASLSTASASLTNAFGTETWQVRVSADFPCNYSIGDGTQTASTTSPFLPANWVEFVTVSPGQRAAAIKAAVEGLVSTSTGAASFWLTELS